MNLWILIQRCRFKIIKNQQVEKLSYLLDQNKRIFNNEIHYFDHPYLWGGYSSKRNLTFIISVVI